MACKQAFAIRYSTMDKNLRLREIVGHGGKILSKDIYIVTVNKG